MIDTCRTPWWSTWGISTVLCRSIPSLIFLVELWALHDSYKNLSCAGSSYLTLAEFALVHLLVPLHPLWLLKAFGCGFTALSRTRLTNLSASFHCFHTGCMSLMVSSWHMTPQFKKYLASVEEHCVWPRKSACNTFSLLFSAVPPPWPYQRNSN